MKIAIGVPNQLDGASQNGFITAFRDIHRALADKKAEGAKRLAHEYDFDRYRRDVNHVFEEFAEA